MNVSFFGTEHELTSKVAYECWQQRGCPYGSPETDWARARTAVARARSHGQDDFSIYSLRLGPDEGCTKNEAR